MAPVHVLSIIQLGISSSHRHRVPTERTAISVGTSIRAPCRKKRTAEAPATPFFAPVSAFEASTGTPSYRLNIEQAFMGTMDELERFGSTEIWTKSEPSNDRASWLDPRAFNARASHTYQTRSAGVDAASAQRLAFCCVVRAPRGPCQQQRPSWAASAAIEQLCLTTPHQIERSACYAVIRTVV